MKVIRWVLVTATAMVAVTAVSFAFDGRPYAWCGWYMRHLVGHDPGPAYNLASNWAHWGRPSGPQEGAIVVWPHHVGKLVGRTRFGQWLVHSGNDGHMVKTRPRSIAGAIAFRMPTTAPDFQLASLETKPVTPKHHDKPVRATTVPPKTIVVWETSSTGTRCVNLAGRMACIARRVVKIG